MQVDGRVLQLLVLEQIIESLLLRHAAPPAVLDRQLAYPSDTTEEALSVKPLSSSSSPLSVHCLNSLLPLTLPLRSHLGTWIASL